MKEDWGKLIGDPNKFGKKDTKLPSEKELEKPKEIRKTYSGIGVAPKMKVAMLAKATEIEKHIKETKNLIFTPEDLLEATKEEWEGKNEYALLREAERSRERWSLSPKTYLALAQALRKKALEVTPKSDSMAA